MTDQQSSRPAVTNTTTPTTNHDTGPGATRELYEAGFSTTGPHPNGNGGAGWSQVAGVGLPDPGQGGRRVMKAAG